MVEQWNSVVEQCGTARWNSGTVEQCGIAWYGTVEQYGKTVKQYGGTVWNKHGGSVEQCEMVWCNSGTAWWNTKKVWWNSATV